MATNTGYGKIPTNGLRLFYDTGDADASFKGKPTTNLVPDAHLMTDWSSYVHGNDGTFMTEFGTVGYKMYNRGSWNGIVRGISLPSSGTYTISAYIRYLGGASDNNGGVVYTSGGGISDTASGHSKVIGEWVRVSMTRTYTTTSFTFYLISYGGTYGGSFSSWEVTMPQVEAGSLATPFVNGSRTTTSSLLDISGVSTLEVMNNPFDGNGNLNLDGTNTFIQVNQDVLSTNSPYTLITVLRPTDLANQNDSFPQYNTYPSGFWHHMGSNGVIAWRHSTGNGTLSGHGMSNNLFGMHTISWDGSSVQLYANGVLTNSAAMGGGYGNNGNGLARMGMLSTRSSGYDYNYNGRIPVNMVYNRALSQSEIFEIYKHFRPRYGLPSIKDGSTSSLAAPSATHLKNLGISKDGDYWLQPSGQSPFQAPVRFFLDRAMVCVMKGGNGSGYVPDSPFWENTTLENQSDFTLTNGIRSKYQSYNVVPFTEFYWTMGELNYRTTFSLSTQVSSMYAAQIRGWNDPTNRSSPHFGQNSDYRTLVGADRRYQSTLGTEIFLMGMDLKHEGHYNGGGGSSGGRIRVGSILDESTGNTGNLTYAAAGSAFGIGVNGGNPLKTGVCGYAGWTEPSIIGGLDNWSIWVVF